MDFCGSSTQISQDIFLNCSTTLFHFLKCDSFPDLNDEFLMKDYRLSCNGTRYTNHKIYVILMILVYPFGIPFTYYFLLWQVRDIVGNKERIKEEKRLDYPTVGHVLFLFESYRTELYFWETIECLRRLGMSSLLVILPEESIMQVTHKGAHTHKHTHARAHITTHKPILTLSQHQHTTFTGLQRPTHNTHTYTQHTPTHTHMFGQVVFAMLFAAFCGRTFCAYKPIIANNRLAEMTQW